MPIVTDPIDPGQVLGQLECLKDGIAAALAQEKELSRVRDERRLVVSREISGREQQDSEEFNALLADLATEHRRALEHQNIRYEARRNRIQNAYHSSRATLADRMQVLKDARIRSAHGNIVGQRQRRQQKLAAAATAHADLKKQLSKQLATRKEIRDSLCSALRSYRFWFFRSVDKPGEHLTDEESGQSLKALTTSLSENLDRASQAAEAAHRLPLAKVFRFLPLLLLLVIIAGVHLWLRHSDWNGLAISGSIVFLLWLAGLILSSAIGRKGNDALRRALAYAQAARKTSSAGVASLKSQYEDEEKKQSLDISGVFNEADVELQTLMREGTKKLERQHARMPGRAEKLHQRNLAKIARGQEQELALAHSQAAETSLLRTRARSKSMAATESIIDANLQKLEEPWRRDVVPLKEGLTDLNGISRQRFPEWTPALTAGWTPPTLSPQSVRIGELEIDIGKLEGTLPASPRLALPQPARFTVPLALGFPEHGSLLIETTGDASPAIEALNATALRLLASQPPGRSSFVFIDPVGLGRGFAGLMHLSDYEETLITHRIWTQTTQIEERLGELCDHIEKVIQMYLRNEFTTIADYNEQAGSVAEKYRFLVIAGFPTAFSETASKRLLSIASSGARCGVHLLMQRDVRQPVESTLLEELHRSCLRVILDHGVFRLADTPFGTGPVTFDVAPPDEDATVLIHRIGKASVDSNRVEVPFSHIAPPPDELWTLEASEELRVPVGRAGAKKLQALAIGKGTRQHMLVAGKTGSGKSTLFHVIITNVALWYSPEQVEFYLVDFKKGVEFKCYAQKRLPHARVVAIESDREFALSVLQQVDTELKRRGEIFRKAGSQDLASYNRGNASPIPRTLLLIDEFQEFFTEDDAVAQQASLLLDRIVRQGRAFGIHVILGSQTLGGAYTLARATLGQMVIRVALQCNEADAHLIMDEDNPAPRLLTRPGEGIYNDQAGALAANSPFQIVWLPEQERDRLLDQIGDLARKEGKIPQVPVVFEGNAPAEIRENQELAAALRRAKTTRPSVARAWLGAPNSIKGPTEAPFQRQSGSHLLIVGQSTERTFSLLNTAILSLASQYAPEQAEFVILDPHANDATNEGSFSRLAELLPHRVRIGGTAELSELLGDVSKSLETRTANPAAEAPEIFVIIRDLQRFKSLRPDDDFRFSLDDDSSSPANPSQVFSNILNEGGPLGLHILATTDTWNNVSRWIPRKLMAEFEMRVLFQMSANDSANLIDSAAASSLGLHRALFHNEHFGSDETFRPYALPDEGWLEEVAALWGKTAPTGS